MSTQSPDDKHSPQYHPWHPISDPVDLKHLGKLAEECGELTQAICRCIIQGMDEHEPDSLKPNRKWLQEEMSDVAANMELVLEHFGFTLDRERITQKKIRLRQWHGMA